MIVPTDNNPITSPRRDRRNLPPSQSNADNVVPLSPSARPSEAQLLMALATMHQQGRFRPEGEQVAGIRGPKSLQKAIDEAEGDEDLGKIKKSLSKRGINPDAVPALEGLK